MRADLLLFRLRLARSRSLAQARIAEGHMRLNGQRLAARDRHVAVGDVLTLPLATGVLVIAIVALPELGGVGRLKDSGLPRYTLVEFEGH